MKISRLDPEIQSAYRFTPPLPVTTRLGRAMINGLLGLMAASTRAEKPVPGCAR